MAVPIVQMRKPKFTVTVTLNQGATGMAAAYCGQHGGVAQGARPNLTAVLWAQPAR